MKTTTKSLWMATMFVAAACNNKKGNEPAPKATNKPTMAATSSTAAPVAPAEPPVVVNPDVKKLVDDVVANCKIDQDSWSVSDCKNNELDAAGKYVSDKSPEDFYVSLGEIAVTDGAKDKARLIAAVAVENATGWGPGKEWLQKNSTPPAARRWLKVIETADDNLASLLGGLPGGIVIYGGMQKDLDAVLAKRKPGSVKNDVLDYYVNYGGTAALASLDAMLKSSTDQGDRSAMVWSAGVALAQPWSSAQESFKLSDADKAKVCDWAKGFLADGMPQVANVAASSLGRCGGAYIDAALDALGKRADTEKVDDGLASALKDQCWAESSINPVNGSTDQCKKDVAILEKMTARKDLDPEGMRTTLWAMKTVAKYGCGAGYGTGPGKDPACVKHVKEVIGKFTSSKDQVVSDEAKGDVKDL